MADKVNAKNSDSKFRPHPEGQFVAQCVDVIDLGEKGEDYAGQPKKLSHKCALVFRTDEQNPETNDLIDIAGEYTVSMSEKANLRRILETWRGKAYSEDELEEVPLDKLEGNWAMIQVDQKTSSNNRKYARIISVTPVPKQMRAHLPAFAVYERAKYGEEKKAAYAKETEAFMAMIAPVESGKRVASPFAAAEDLPDDAFVGDDDDDLPF